MQLRKFSLAWALAGAALLASGLPVSTALADSATDDPIVTQDDPGWVPTYIRDEGNNSFLSSRTPSFRISSFRANANRLTYPFTMVGTDPRLGGSTTVATAIIPLRFNSVAG